MLTTAKLNSPGQACAYHEQDYSSVSERYYTQGNAIKSEWIGPMAADFGLRGEVDSAPYKMLANGKSPTGEQLVRFKKAAEYVVDGRLVKASKHTVGQDVTFSAPQSFSAAAILGRDMELRKAHEEAVKAAMAAVGRYVQARMSRNRVEMTGHWVAAVFHHDSARPVGDFSSVALHDHVVLFNMTRTADGKTRAMQTQEVYGTKRLGTSVYRAELARAARALGYQITRGEHGQPEIAGYKPQFLDALAVRKAQITKYVEEHGVSAQVAAHQTRESKRNLSPDELFDKNMALAKGHGVDPAGIRAAAQMARKSVKPLSGEEIRRFAELCVTYGIAKNMEREAVADERQFLADALARGLGEVSLQEVQTVLDGRIASGQVIDLERQVMQHGRFDNPNRSGTGTVEAQVVAGEAHPEKNTLRSRLTTAAMLEMERSNLAVLDAGQGAVPRLVTPEAVAQIDQSTMTASQQAALRDLAASLNRIQVFIGLAGTGKCLARGTDIILHCGCIKPVEQIKVGDLLMGPDSKPREVLSLAHGFDQMYQVTPVKGDPYCVNRSHILSLKMTTGHKLRHGCSERKHGRPCHHLNVPRSYTNGEIINISVTEYLRRGTGFKKNAKGWRCGVEFPERPVPIDPYFIGVWLGDGAKALRTVEVTKPDQEIRECLEMMSREWSLSVVEREKDGSENRRNMTHTLSSGSMKGKPRLHRNALLDEMRTLGLTNNCHVPELYKINSRKIRMEVLAGLLDTDGSFDSKGNCYDFISKYEILASDMAFLARSVGLAAYKQQAVKQCQNGFKGNYWRVCISGNAESIPVRIERRKGRRRLQKKDVLRTGVTLKPAGTGEYFGFELDKDGLFLLGDFTVTHNSRTLNSLRRAAEIDGYTVIGISPTSLAAQELATSAGIANPVTLQAFLMQKEAEEPGKRLLMVDEASLASTRMIAALWQKIRPEDRVLLVGDTRQHQSVEAGRFLSAAIEHGVGAVRLEGIIRQQDADIRRVVELVAAGRTEAAVQSLWDQGRIHEVADGADRIRTIAKGYAKCPAGTLVISPDNTSRQELNAACRQELRAVGLLAEDEQTVRVLIQRGEMTGADREFAAKYAVGDAVRYSKGSQEYGIRPGEYARVTAVIPKENRITVKTARGTEVTYDPARLRGVSVYKEEERGLAVGDRVQLTAPFKAKRLPNRVQGTVEKIDAQGNILLKLDSGRQVAFNIREHPQLDYGYASTSYSIQGLTSNSMLLNVDTEKSASLVNERLGYVAFSRASHDIFIATNNAGDLATKLGRQNSKTSAVQEVGL